MTDKIQSGVMKVVSKINNIEIPSIPNLKLKYPLNEMTALATACIVLHSVMGQCGIRIGACQTELSHWPTLSALLLLAELPIYGFF